MKSEGVSMGLVCREVYSWVLDECVKGANDLSGANICARNVVSLKNHSALYPLFASPSTFFFSLSPRLPHMKLIETVTLGFIFGTGVVTGVLLLGCVIEKIIQRRTHARETDTLIAAIERAPGRYTGQFYGTQECQ